ncbi:MAG: hypothetical protein ACOC1U_03785 [Spirochaetota bacterium]
MSTITPDEFNERVAILRRFKRALTRQRDRFRAHLERLEQREVIASPASDTEFHEELQFFSEMERSIVHEIASFERTIEPLETLYRAHDRDGAGDIPALRAALDRTRDEVLRRTSENQKLMRREIDALREQIAADSAASRSPVRRPVHALAGAYRRRSDQVLVDVTA